MPRTTRKPTPAMIAVLLEIASRLDNGWELVQSHRWGGGWDYVLRQGPGQSWRCLKGQAMSGLLDRELVGRRDEPDPGDWMKRDLYLTITEEGRGFLAALPTTEGQG